MKRMAVIGAGESGVGAALLGKKMGYDVFVSDISSIQKEYKEKLSEEKIEFEEGSHSKDLIHSADLIVKSPGIPRTAELIDGLITEGKEVIGEIEFASRFTNSFVVAITGSNGKTTTTNMVYHVLKKSGKDVAMVGNVGESFAGKLAERNYDVFVAEISSFQLDDTTSFKPNISVIMNITPDHLNRYNYNIDEYVASKFRICKNQGEGDVFLYCKDDKKTLKSLNKVPGKVRKIAFSQSTTLEEGAWVQDDNILFQTNNKPFSMSVYEMALPGKHNIYNTMAAGIVADLMGISKESIRQSLQDFKSLEHRMEPVASIRGIEFINDSKATNVNSTWYALESMTKDVVWIAGGVNKGNDYAEIMPLVKKKVKAIICLGTDNEHLTSAFSDAVDVIEETKSMRSAVKMAYYLAGKNSAVLLSPACASFDLFKNYEDRGNQFRQAVREL